MRDEKPAEFRRHRGSRFWLMVGLLPVLLSAGSASAPGAGGSNRAEGGPSTNSQTYDILLIGGHLIDPRNGINGPRDVAISQGKIAEVAEKIDPAKGRKIVDVSGAYVVPGLIDLHTHVFIEDPGGWGIYPDMHSFPYGVTTAVDAGTSGWENFEQFKTTIIDKARTRVLAFLNVVSNGMGKKAEQTLSEISAERTKEVLLKYPEILVGVKTAHYRGPEWEALDRAFRAAGAAGVPVMVDFRPTETRTYEDLLLKHMRPGDMHTHMYARHIPLLDENGRVNDYMRRARERGVLFDVGHGAGSFWFRIGVPAMQQGFGPDSISTDLHARSRLIPVADLMTTMSKFLNMGMELEEVIRRTTVTPARAIHRPQLGHLSVGAEADVAVLELKTGKFGFVDSGHAKMQGTRKLRCLMTIRAGKIVWDVEGLSWPDWREAGNYDVLE